MKGPCCLRARSLPLSARSTTLLVLALGLFSAVGQAATATWIDAPVSGNWSVGANWVGGSPPNPGDDLLFPAGSAIRSTTNDLPAGFSINSIYFIGGSYSLAGNSIALGAAGIHCLFGGSGTVSLPITIPGDIVLDAGSGCTLTVSGAIDGDGGVTTGGLGEIVLSGNDSYTGMTSVGGYLIVNGTLSGTSQVSLLPGIPSPGAVGGDGTITNDVQLGYNCYILPGQGSSTGILSTGNLTFTDSGSLAFKLNGTTVGTEYDQLNVTGMVTLGSNMSHLEVIPQGFVPAHGTQFTIIKNNGGSPISGTFAGLPEGATFVINITTFQISYVGGSGQDVVLTVISPWVPTSLAVDSGGNGVLEANELASIQPTWTNSSGSSASLTASTTNFTGPNGATYSNPDASGNYGTIADGVSAQCTTCYSVQITSASRPTQHWDGAIDETITPTSIKETWVLHVGESFPDVPTSQPFYTFIENLFHNGVTGGCASGGYCPDSPVTRAQMAVFLLKAEHESSYVPPACTGTFGDVPCPSLFADWIEELFHEGITGGCGSDNYCPYDPVRRDQMAAFLLKAAHGSSYVPPACTGIFPDVTCPSQFADWVEQLFYENITGGCGNGDYCPGNPNTRGQMAVFLVKTFGLLLYKP